MRVALGFSQVLVKGHSTAGQKIGVTREIVGRAGDVSDVEASGDIKVDTVVPKPPKS